VGRGFAADETSGVDVDDAVLAPELTVTAEGVHWHPIGGDLDSSPDLLITRGKIPLAEAKQLIMWSSSQIPHILRWTLAEGLGLGVDQVRAIAPRVGGAFGNKQYVTCEEIVVAMLAIQTGRPVKWN